MIVPELSETPANRFIGVDLNITGHVAIVSNSETGKIWKFGKEANHSATKYREIRRKLQSQEQYGKVKEIKNRQERLIRNLNHHISKKLVQIARDGNSGIKL
ncbi:MAG TPA: hypothetical protein VHA09_05385 [Nitrososphaera sp.]|nr:hypothetical protein [Nitrososphaera sp.]